MGAGVTMTPVGPDWRKMRIKSSPLVSSVFTGTVYTFDVSVVQEMISGVDGKSYLCYNSKENGWWFVDCLEEVYDSNEWGEVSP